MGIRKYTLEYYRWLALKRLYESRESISSQVEAIGHASVVASLINRANPLAQWVNDPAIQTPPSRSHTKHRLRGVHITDEGIAWYEARESHYRTEYPELYGLAL